MAKNWTQTKIADFGLASNVRMNEKIKMTKITTNAPFPKAYTPQYAAPEWLREESIVNRAGDM